MEQTPEQIIENLNKNIEDLKTKIEAKPSTESLDALKTELAEKQEELSKIDDVMKAQGTKIVELENAIKNGSVSKVAHSFAEQLSEQFEQKQQDVEDFISKKTNSLKFELKAPANMYISGITPDSFNVATTASLPGLTDIRRVRPTILDYIAMPRIDAYNIDYIEKKTPEGAVVVTAEGVTKPNLDINIAKGVSTAETYPGIMTTSRQMMRSVPFIAAEIEKEIVYQIRKALQSAIATEITAAAQAYTLTTIETTTPNNYDAIEAAVAQMITVFAEPDLIRLNPIDRANMNISKGTNGHYVFPQFLTADGTKISGLMVIEDNNIPVGTVSIIETRSIDMYLQEELTIRMSEHDGDNFKQNLISVLGELAVHLFIKENNEPGIFQDTFANIKTAITA